MPPTTTRRVKSQQTKRKIFDAAARLMRSKGEDYLTIANICAEAGVSKGTFFYHFQSKDDLMQYYLREGLDDFSSEHESAIEAGDDPYLQVLALYDGYVQYCQSAGIEFVSSYYTPKNKALDSHASMGTPDTMNTILRASVDSLSRAQAAGYVRQDWNATDMAFDCCSVVKGCIFEWCLSDGRADLMGRVRHMLSIYFNSVVTDAYRERFAFAPEPEPAR